MLVDPDGELGRLAAGWNLLVNAGTAVWNGFVDACKAGAQFGVNVISGNGVIDSFQQLDSDLRDAYNKMVTGVGQAWDTFVEEVTTGNTTTSIGTGNGDGAIAPKQGKPAGAVGAQQASSVENPSSWPSSFDNPVIAILYVIFVILPYMFFGTSGSLFFPGALNDLPYEVFVFAAIIFGEAGDLTYPKNERIAVAWVVRNRVEDASRWSNFTYFQVLTQTYVVNNVTKYQFEAYRHANGKYFRAMNYLRNETIYSGQTTATNDERQLIRECLHIAVGVYLNSVYTIDLSRGAVAFWWWANAPDWAPDRTGTPKAVLEGVPLASGGWRHTFWK